MSGSNVPLILAIAGCVALLAGLFGGGVKAKDVEIPTISSIPRIFSGVAGLALVGAATWLYAQSFTPPAPQSTPVPAIAAAPSETSAPATVAPVAAATDSAAPLPSATLADTATALPAVSPSPIVADPTNPAGFLRYYFDLLTERRNYGDAWQLMTRKYQKQVYANDYIGYGAYWTGIGRVTLNDVQVTQLTGSSVDCHVDMTLRTIGGLDQQLSADYRLIYDSQLRTWLFDTP